MQHLRTARDLDTALTFLAEQDRLIAQAITEVGPPVLRKRRTGFAGLMSILIGQQVSVAAAQSIENRLVATMGKTTPEAFLALSVEQCRACGLSVQKQRYLRALAEALVSGQLRLSRLAQCDTEEVSAALQSIPGIGPWTADMYLMFIMRRADIFAPGDLALQEGYRRLASVSQRPTPKDLGEIALRWMPFRSAAALVLWRYYTLGPK